MAILQKFDKTEDLRHKPKTQAEKYKRLQEKNIALRLLAELFDLKINL